MTVDFPNNDCFIIILLFNFLEAFACKGFASHCIDLYIYKKNQRHYSIQSFIIFTTFHIIAYLLFLKLANLSYFSLAVKNFGSGKSEIVI